MSLPHGPNPDQVRVKGNDKKNTPAQRRGPKGYFHGSRKEFLESQLPAYLACKKGSRQGFWHKLYSAWWQRYPWKLDDDKEPPTDDPEQMARLAAVAPGDETAKSLVERTLTERLSKWFTNRAAAASNESRRDTLGWLPLLQRLHQVRNSRPRKRTVVQQFMLEYSREVNTAFVSRHSDGKNLSNAQRLNLRYDVAKTLLSNQYSRLVNELENRAKAQHDTEMEEWNLILEDISLADDVSRARDTLFDAAYPLLKAIGSYAGCYVTLIAGNADKDDADKEFFTAVHWWPGDRTSMKDWTQWDENRFNSGVAGPFLEYAGETNQLLQAAGSKPPTSTIETPQVSPPLTLPNAAPIIDSPLSAGDPSPTRIQSQAATAVRQANYRPLPAKSTSAKLVEGTKKRKHTSKEPRVVRYFEGSESEDDKAGSDSGDGSSSGESISSNAPAKRPRTSRIATRSSSRASAPGTGAEGTLDSASPAIPNSDTGTGTSADAMDVDDSEDSPRVSHHAPLAGTPDTAPTETEDAHNTDPGDPATNADSAATNADSADSAATNADSAAASTEATSTTNVKAKESTAIETEATPTVVTEPVTTTSAANLGLHSPLSPVSLNDIDEAIVPSFLLRHGKGKREVNIFGYLSTVGDSRFQKVLFHYLHFEVNDRSEQGGVLPTAKRPIEISRWSSRARPAGLPDYTKSGRTFADFVDSTFAWWASIQPSWRTFERGRVSREVHGGWDVLHAPRINGLLNVVMLVYWWISVLEEHKPEGSSRADYEFFADDVAWVFSNLSA